MNTKPESKPPEETATPSTVSLPSYQEWYDFFRSLTDGSVLFNIETNEELALRTMRFLAQRGSPR